MTDPLDPRDIDDAANAFDDGAIARLLQLDAIWDSDRSSLPMADGIVAAIRSEQRADDLPPIVRSGLAPSVRPVGALRGGLKPITIGVAAAALAIAAYSIIDRGEAQAPDTITADTITGDTITAGAVTPDVVVVMTSPAGAPSSTVTAEVSDLALGTWIRLDIVGLPPAAPGTYYEAWMTRPSGDNVSAGTFHMRGGDGQIVLWAGVTTADYPMLLVTVQDEGFAARSQQVVLQARIDS
jgi:hypothetical protein